MMMLGAMLWMTSCTSEDATKEVAPQEAIAISFGCNYDDEEEDITKNTTRAGYEGAMNTEDLYTTGFGAMASVTAGTDDKPNLMYNQEVKYTHVGDMENPLTGYWSYQPVKYWPTDLTHCYISAYAPYMSPDDLAALARLSEEDLEKETGIIGISPNTEEPYITYRRCEKPNEVVDLLWYYKKFKDTDKIPEATTTLPAGTLNMKMRHALTRLEIKVALKEGTVLAEGTKVLIDSITLTGTMTRTAKLILNDETVVEGKHYPKWQALDPADTENRTIIIDNEDNNSESYGIIDAQVRYIPGMPYSWQPAGLKVYDSEAEEGTDNGMRNALSTGGKIGYIYLIPLGTLSLTVKVKYHKMTAGSDEVKIKTADTPITISPFYGNIPYSLNLTLSNI